MSPPARRTEPGAATRGLAARAVAGVLGGVNLDASLAGLELEALSAPDRAQVKALAFGALRGHHRHRCLLSLLLDRPLAPGSSLIESLLSVGLFQLLDERQPDYAAVSSTVEAARWLGQPQVAGLVNATLRRLLRERAELLSRAMVSDEGRYSHPSWLIEQLKRDWPDDWRAVLECAQQQPPLWLRVNATRQTADGFRARLAESGLAGEPEAGLPDALRLTRPLPVGEIPGFAQGEVSVQDAASQLAADLLAPAPGMRVLDACAAPGGKATHLLERAAGRLDLTALDIDAKRLTRVRDNLNRLGLAANVVAGDALLPDTWWDGRPFDRILVDAPCSGTGVIRRHPDIKCLRRESDVASLARRQLALLGAVWPLLRTGGLLLYATCSILKEENARVVAAFLGKHGDAAPAPGPGRMPVWARPEAHHGWQILPGPAGTDGLYYALMTR